MDILNITGVGVCSFFGALAGMWLIRRFPVVALALGGLCWLAILAAGCYFAVPLMSDAREFVDAHIFARAGER